MGGVGSAASISTSPYGSNAWQGVHTDAPTVLTKEQAERYGDINMVDESELVYGALLGRGGFGEVYAATWSGQKVAVKSMKGGVVRSMGEWAVRVESLLSEVKTLQRCRHENLVACIGITSQWPFKLLYELCEGGDLHNQLSGSMHNDYQWTNRYRVMVYLLLYLLGILGVDVLGVDYHGYTYYKCRHILLSLSLSHTHTHTHTHTAFHPSPFNTHTLT